MLHRSSRILTLFVPFLTTAFILMTPHVVFPQSPTNQEHTGTDHHSGGDSDAGDCHYPHRRGCVDTTLVDGVQDDFAPGNSEPLSPSRALLDWIPYQDGDRSWQQTEFDVSVRGTNRVFAHSMRLPDSFDPQIYTVQAATLTLGLRASTGQTYNDRIQFLHEDSSGMQSIWANNIGELNGGSWARGDRFTLRFDLANMPHPSNRLNSANILEILNDGVLDIYIQDETGVDYIELDVEYCRTEAPCDCIRDAQLDAACCNYDFTLTNRVGSPIASIAYKVEGGTVQDLSVGPCSFRRFASSPSSGHLVFGPRGCDADALHVGAALSTLPSNGTGRIVLNLSVTHLDGEVCHLTRAFRCTPAPLSQCDELKWSFYSFDPNNISGRRFTIHNRKLPRSPITHVEVEFDPPVRPGDHRPLAVNGGNLIVDGSPNHSLWGPQPNYSHRIPNAPQELSPSADARVSFWLGIDRLQKWHGTVRFTVVHADGQKCTVGTKWDTRRHDIDLVGTGRLRRPTDSTRQIFVSELIFPATIGHAPVGFVSIEPEMSTDSLLSISGAPVSSSGTREMSGEMRGTYLSDRAALIEIRSSADGDGSGDLYAEMSESLRVHVVVSTDGASADVPLRVTYHAPDGRPYGTAEQTLNGENSITSSDPSLSDAQTFTSNGNVRLMSVSPNPAFDEVTLTFNLVQPDEVVVDLYDVRGTTVREMQSHVLEGGNHQISVDVSGLPKGTYFVRIENSKGTTVRKVSVGK